MSIRIVDKHGDSLRPFKTLKEHGNDDTVIAIQASAPGLSNFITVGLTLEDSRWLREQLEDLERSAGD